MTAFFIPGIADDKRASESAYGEIRHRTELDMGPREPFVVWRQQEPGESDAQCEVLRCNAYAVLEVDA